MSTALKLTVAEYDEMVLRGAFDGLQKKIELFRGALVEMNPAGPIHDDYIAYLNRWSIQSTLDQSVLVRIQSGLSLPELDSRPELDVMWVRDRRYLDRNPESQDVLLIIEVSDSSKQYDRVQKALLYAQAGIEDFWVVDVQESLVVVHRQPTSGGYQHVASFGENCCICTLVAPKAELSIRELLGN